MSEYQFVEKEIQQIDELLAENYIFKSIKEDLEGAFVTFMNVENNDDTLASIYFGHFLKLTSKANS